MLGVVFHFDHKPNFDAAARRFLFQCYDYTCRAFKVDRVVVVDPFETSGQAAYDTVKTVDDAIFTIGLQPVYVHQSADMVVGEFSHPRDAAYVVGPNLSALTVPGDAMAIRVDYPDDAMELWSHVALGIVLSHRRAAMVAHGR